MISVYSTYIIKNIKGLPSSGPKFFTAQHSLVHSSVVSLLPGEAKHAADDAAVHLRPFLITDLPPAASVLNLHVALRHRRPLAHGRQDCTDADVLNVDVQVLQSRHSVNIQYVNGYEYIYAYTITANTVQYMIVLKCPLVLHIRP